MRTSEEIKLYSDNGGGNQNPNLIVVHALAEFIWSPPHRRHFTAYDYLNDIDGTSYHKLITPSGTTIVMRPDNKVAYHAKGFNVNSLGIAVMLPGGHDYASFKTAIENPFVTEESFVKLIDEVSLWRAMHDITVKRVVQHSAIDPKRKTDPGAGFPWDDFQEAIS